MINAETPQQTAALIGDQIFQQAIAFHQAGQLQDAERLYRAVLKIQPNHLDANHNLDLITEQVNQIIAELPNFRAALEADPRQGKHWQDYAEALLIAGQGKEAQVVISIAKQHGLDTPTMQTLLQRAKDATLDELVENTQAESKASEVLQQNDQEQADSNVIHPDKVQKTKKNFVEKSEFTKKKKTASKLAPIRKSLPKTKVDQLIALFNAGRFVELETNARLLLNRYPHAGFVWKVLGTSLQLQDKDALHALRKATELLPNDDEAHSNLGVFLDKLGHFEEAQASCRRALQIKPSSAEAQYNLGNALLNNRQFNDAVSSYRQALDINPDDAETYNNLGSALTFLGQLDDAVSNCLKALEIKPDYAEAYNNLGIALRDLGQYDEALASYRQAVQIKPDYAVA